MSPIIVFHSLNGVDRHCMDGWASAVVAYHAMKYLDPELIPCVYGQSLILPDNFAQRPIFFLDVVPTNFRFHWDRAESVTIIDHHIGMEKEYENLISSSTKLIIFDVHHSACMLTHTFFHNTRPAHALLRHIEDYDLWRFHMPDTREIVAALGSYPMTLESWASISMMPRDLIISEGSAILRYMNQQVESLCQTAGVVSLNGEVFPCVNSPILVDQIGNRLAEMHNGVGVIYHELPQGGRKYSIRSTGAPILDIAKQFGGGGHLRSAGFRGPHPGIVHR